MLRRTMTCQLSSAPTSYKIQKYFFILASLRFLSHPLFYFHVSSFSRYNQNYQVNIRISFPSVLSAYAPPVCSEGPACP